MSKLVLSPPTTSLCLKYAVPSKLTPDVIDFLSGSNAAKAYFLVLSLRQTVIGPSVSMPVLKQMALVFLTFKPLVWVLGTKSLYSLSDTEILMPLSRFKFFIVKAEPSALIVLAVKLRILLSSSFGSSVSVIKAEVNLPVIVRSPDTEAFPFLRMGLSI